MLRVNALTVGGSALELVGPHQASPLAGAALRDAGRLQSISISALRASGFSHFAWVFKAERPGGHALAEVHEQGAFVYCHEDGSFYFYQ